MSYLREVENLLGKECKTELLNHVRGGKMSDNQFEDFVRHLGGFEDPNTLYGKHTQRTNRDRERGRDTELRQVLCDWWERKLFELTKEEAINALVEALSQPDVNCKPLAFKLSTITDEVVPVKYLL